jgi:hypothetical protein
MVGLLIKNLLLLIKRFLIRSTLNTIKLKFYKALNPTKNSDSLINKQVLGRMIPAKSFIKELF